MNTIYIIPIEPIDQRYTKQWYDNIPTLINEKIQEYSIKKYKELRLFSLKDFKREIWTVFCKAIIAAKPNFQELRG